MMNSKISSRYALSLMDLAEEKNSLPAIYDDVKTIVGALDGSSQLRKLLVNPIVKSKVKSSIFDEIFTGKITPDMQKFIRFLVEKNREDYLYWIMKQFLDLRNTKLGIVEAQVTTAVKFNEKQTLELKRKLESILGKKVELNFVIDKEILGGFIAKVGDTLYDGSIKNQLVNLKRQFLQGSTF
jgi:F-type H+-transporting ATPase subunit delta